MALYCPLRSASDLYPATSSRSRLAHDWVRTFADLPGWRPAQPVTADREVQPNCSAMEQDKQHVGPCGHETSACPRAARSTGY